MFLKRDQQHINTFSKDIIIKAHIIDPIEWIIPCLPNIYTETILSLKTAVSRVLLLCLLLLMSSPDIFLMLMKNIPFECSGKEEYP